MCRSSAWRRALWLLPLLASPAAAQDWRRTAEGVGTTARVLIIGTRPEDEDNALMAWLSLGQDVETAYLSLTRGESSPNVLGNERQAALAVVRTAELLAERRRDGAHQYFTRAYDFGPTPADSLVDAGWPHDSLLADVVSVIRAFRPHVIVSLFSDSTDRDATHRVAARLAREAFAAAADTLRLPPARTSRLPAWTVARLFTRVDGPAAGLPYVAAVDVGAFDHAAGRSYAELGAEIRQLQRTQPPLPAPPIGPLWRLFRLDSARAGRDPAATLVGAADSAWSRFRAGLPAAAPSLDSLQAALSDARAVSRAGSSDSAAAALARVVQRVVNVRAAVPCGRVADVPSCAGVAGDLAVSLDRIQHQAAAALAGAAAIVVDATVGRELVAAGDSVAVSVTVFNGGRRGVLLRRLTALTPSGGAVLLRDSTWVPPDSGMRWSGSVRVQRPTFHWWQVNGLLAGTWLHAFQAQPGTTVIPELIAGEDRIPASAVHATVALGGTDVPLPAAPLVYRSTAALRGDDRHPLTGVTPVSVLLERSAEYERAGLPIDRLFRVYVWSAASTPDTLAVSLRLPPGLRADSTTRTVVLPPFGSRNVFFRLRGTLAPGSDSISASARRTLAPSAPAPLVQVRMYTYGAISHDYPHIPTQLFVRSSAERVESVDLRVPARLRVAYVRGSDDVQTPLGQLQVNLQTIEPSLLPVVDLSVFSTVLIGAGALANDALAGAVPALQQFMRKGGTVVVLPGGGEIARSGLLPYPVVFDTTPGRVSDPEAAVRVVGKGSPLLRWPNRITAADFGGWTGERARGVPAGFDARYATVLAMGDAGQPPTAATLLVAPVGKGTIVYTSLSLDRQLAAVNPGAARLFVNLLSAGSHRAGPPPTEITGTGAPRALVAVPQRRGGRGWRSESSEMHAGGAG